MTATMQHDIVPFFDAIERAMNKSTEAIATAVNALSGDLLYIEAHKLYSVAATINHAGTTPFNVRHLTLHEQQAWEAASALCIHVGNMLKANVEEMGSGVDSTRCFLYLARLRTAAAICAEVRRNWELRQKV